jgi:hypothetical protein
MARRSTRQPNYIKHARSFGHGSGRRKRTTSFSDAVATMRLSKSARHSHHSKIYGKIAKYALMLLLILGWGSLPIFLPFFRISSVTYTGFSSPELQKTAEKTVASVLTTDKPWWPRNNFFIFNTEALTTELLKEPRLRSVDVQKTFPHNLVITAAEKSSRLVYFSATGNHAVLDEEGGFQQPFRNETSTSFIAETYFSHTPLSPSTTVSTTIAAPLTFPSLALSDSDIKAIPLGLRALPRLIDYRVQTTTNAQVSTTGTSVLSPAITQKILEWSDALSSSALGKMVAIGIDGEAAPYRLIIKTAQSWKIISDTSKTPAEQLNELSLLLKTQKPQQYIDMRFDGRLYWK